MTCHDTDGGSLGAPRAFAAGDLETGWAGAPVVTAEQWWTAPVEGGTLVGCGAVCVWLDDLDEYRVEEAVRKAATFRAESRTARRARRHHQACDLSREAWTLQLRDWWDPAEQGPGDPFGENQHDDEL